MGKKVIIISSSYRREGNSDLLAREFDKGAEAAGNVVETINLRDITMNFCQGCLACQQTKECIIHDDVRDLVEKIRWADVLCFATPIYYYAMSGQLKTFLDRMNPIYAAGHTFTDVYLLASANDTDPSAMDGAVKEVEGWVSCFDGVELKGVVRANGVNDVGDILNHREYLDEAYDMGRYI
jgi:NAD(P)H-dependent FMN reductase